MRRICVHTSSWMAQNEWNSKTSHRLRFFDQFYVFRELPRTTAKSRERKTGQNQALRELPRTTAKFRELSFDGFVQFKGW